jgi:tRNA dimethylallyltransferase
VIVGPTGSGKSDFAVRLAQRIGAPVISTDSRQVYRGMSIGTAQPTEEQINAVPHHFIADRPPTERFTCGDFEREALAKLNELFKTHTHVVAVGGSGLYIDALCDGLDPMPDLDPALRKTLTDRLERDGLAPLLDELRTLDPVHYEVVDRANPARVIRALEVCLATGRPFSEQRTGASLRKSAQERTGSAQNSGAQTQRPFDIVKIGIDLPRAELYARIDSRVDAMMAAGLEQEARALHPLKHLPALQTVGYSELFAYFDGEYDLARAVELIKRNSRRYAKRQMTWFRRDESIRWLTPDELKNPPESYLHASAPQLTTPSAER